MEIAGIISFILSLGVSVFIPIVLILLSLAFRVKASEAVRAGIMIGIGFIGINLVIGLFLGNLGPIAQAMVGRLGIKLEVLDVGWPSAAAIAFASLVGTLVIPVCFAVNLAMLVLGLTKTIDIDLWNYWHFAFTGALVHAITGDLTMGIVAAAADSAIVYKLGDWTAKDTQKLMDIPGISLPHGFSAAYVPIAVPIKKAIDFIPPLRDIKADPETIRKRLGILGEPALIGLIIGLVLAILAGQGVAGIATTGMTMAAVMVLLPRMVKILMEGLLPISEGVREWFVKHFPGRELYLGLDSAIAIGHETAIAASLILIPITLILAIIVPGNRMLPFTDLAVLPFMVCMVVPVVGGNVIHTVIIGTLVIAVGLLIGTNLSVPITQAAISAGFPIPAGVTLISSICDGANPLTWVIFQIVKYAGLAGGIVLLALTFVGAAASKYLRKPAPPGHKEK